MSVMNTALLAALRTVNDPELHRDLVSLGMVQAANLESGIARVHIQLTTPACPLKDQIAADIKAALFKLSEVSDVSITFSARVAQSQPEKQSVLENVSHVILVGSGKGGVGKSSVAVNLAVSLTLDGARVGLLDADVYGPSVAHMMGLPEARIQAGTNKKLLPLESHGVQFLSMANLAAAGQALVWRGPMLHSAISQLLKDAAWGELDYLVVDLPPGTGDVQLSLSQLVNITGAVVVTTPQQVALIDAARAINMFTKASIPVLGIIENMSYFIAPDTGHSYDLFGRGGSQALGGHFFLGEIPIDTEIRTGADAGLPVVLSQPESAAATALRGVARTLAGQISIRSLGELPIL